MDEQPRENSVEPNDNSASLGKKYSTIWTVISFGVIAAVVYFGNVELQSYLGKRALDDTGLTLLSLDEATKKAADEGKLVLADMSAIWCANCRKLDREVLSKEAVKSVIDKYYVFSRIEYESEQGQAFMEKYNVRGFPTLLILDVHGQMVRKVNLSFDPKEFIHSLVSQ